MLANLLAALAITGLQLVTLIAAALLRGIDFNATGAGVLWFAAAALLLGVAMSAIAETLASRVPRQEEYMARVPAIAIVPWFVAGSLFSIGALPAAPQPAREVPAARSRARRDALRAVGP